MARIAEFTEKTPLKLTAEDLDDGGAWICRCGLTGKGPFCDGSHVAAKDEPDGTRYIYRREEGKFVREPVDA